MPRTGGAQRGEDRGLGPHGNCGRGVALGPGSRSARPGHARAHRLAARARAGAAVPRRALSLADAQRLGGGGDALALRVHGGRELGGAAGVELLAGGGEPQADAEVGGDRLHIGGDPLRAVPGGSSSSGRTARSTRRARARMAGLGPGRQVGHGGGALEIGDGEDFAFPVWTLRLHDRDARHHHLHAVLGQVRQRLGDVAVRESWSW